MHERLEYEHLVITKIEILVNEVYDVLQTYVRKKKDSE